MEKISIIIVDDEPLTRMALKKMLEVAGYNICGEANNGKAAIELAIRHKPDIAILDIKMPELDGIEVAKTMHELNIPVVLLTAYSKQNFINRAEKVMVYTYLVKPVTEDMLLPAIQLTCARWKEMQQMQNELQITKNKLNNQKTIAKARAIIAKNKNIPEFDAHQELLRLSMNQNISLIELSKRIIKDIENP